MLSSHATRWTNRAGLVVATALLASVAACSDSGTDPEPPLLTAEQVTFAAELGIDLSAMNRLPQGVYWQDVIESHPDSAQAQPFQVLFVHYSGWLSNGTRFADDLPFSFLLSGGEAISGWDLGLLGIRVGGKRRLVVPPASGYGHFDTGAIPGNSVTVYDIQVDSIRIPL